MRFARILLPLAVVLGTAGCSGVQPTAAAAPCGPAGTPLKRTPAQLAHLVSSLQREYARGDWSSIRSSVTNPNLASGIVAQMRDWSVRHVTHLSVSLVFVERLASGLYAGTVQYEADPRAPPTIGIYEFGLRNGALKIVGAVTGVCGSRFDQADWAVTRAQHFIVYHSPFQLEGSDRIFLSYLEDQRARFASRFRVHLPALTVIYLYPSQPLMKSLTHGGCGQNPSEIGCTNPLSSPPTIQTVIQAAFHEPIHVYERSISPPNKGPDVYVAPLFIGEGTAVALEDRQLDPRLSDYCSDLQYAPLDDCARDAISNVDPMSVLSDKGFNHANAGDGYALGGSFVKYLILRSGYYRFGRFYYVLAAQPKDRLQDYEVAAHRVYGQSIESLISTWKRSLCVSGC